jgi:hypothetical protein
MLYLIIPFGERGNAFKTSIGLIPFGIDSITAANFLISSVVQVVQVLKNYGACLANRNRPEWS